MYLYKIPWFFNMNDQPFKSILLQYLYVTAVSEDLRGVREFGETPKRFL